MKEKRNFLILGLGRATTPIVKFLLKRGERVFGYDLIEEKKNQFSSSPNFTFISSEMISQLPRPIVAIVSPGIAENNPLVLSAQEIGEVVSDVEFIYQVVREERRPMIVAITGTNGKSTTTALLGSILKMAKRKVFFGGNLAPGKPAGCCLFGKDEILVFEVSSFQLEKIKEFRPRVAILLNIQKDHLDRYLSWEDYFGAKRNIFRNQTEDDIAILNYDDPGSRMMAKEIRSKIFWFSSKRKKFPGIYWQNGKGLISLSGKREMTLRLPQKEWLNLENILAVSLAASLLGITEKEIINGIKNFSGLPHRMEFVRKVRGVSFVNNSMATNPSAFASSLNSFSRPVILIAGGKNKGFSLKEYLKPIEERSKFLILIGEVKEKLYQSLPSAVRKRTYLANSLREAVKEAFLRARRNDIVLFSPGFSSFDMFRDFIDRGNSFKKMVRSL
jgi:UDP-N-acetylmuramoylalanine--D-glutamate ligase